MGGAMSLPTARIVAPLSFAINFAAQQYGMLYASPNMKEVSDSNYSPFTPWPYSIAIFFGPQQILQLAYLYNLVFASDAKREDQAVDYAPYYVAGNMLIATWLGFWSTGGWLGSFICCALNTGSQAHYVYTRLDTTSSTNRLTYFTSCTFYGIGVFDVLHSGAVAFYRTIPPSALVQAATGLGFIGLASVSTPTVGACLVYDLLGLAAGQSGTWQLLLGAFAVATGGIVATKARQVGF